jgi:hypothetical protein
MFVANSTVAALSSAQQQEDQKAILATALRHSSPISVHGFDSFWESYDFEISHDHHETTTTTTTTNDADLLFCAEQLFDEDYRRVPNSLGVAPRQIDSYLHSYLLNDHGDRFSKGNVDDEDMAIAPISLSRANSEDFTIFLPPPPLLMEGANFPKLAGLGEPHHHAAAKHLCSFETDDSSRHIYAEESLDDTFMMKTSSCIRVRTTKTPPSLVEEAECQQDISPLLPDLLDQEKEQEGAGGYEGFNCLADHDDDDDDDEDLDGDESNKASSDSHDHEEEKDDYVYDDDEEESDEDDEEEDCDEDDDTLEDDENFVSPDIQGSLSTPIVLPPIRPRPRGKEPLRMRMLKGRDNKVPRHSSTSSVRANPASPVKMASSIRKITSPWSGTQKIRQGPPRFRQYQAESWSRRFYELQDFVKTYGHALVPHNFPSNQGLARWAKRQRYQYKLYQSGAGNSAMTEERISILDRTGFCWDAHKSLWNERFKALEEFKELHGHVNVSSNGSSNRKLATWVKCQRRQYKLWALGKQANINEERIETLNAIGFRWSLLN